MRWAGYFLIAAAVLIVLSSLWEISLVNEIQAGTLPDLNEAQDADNFFAFSALALATCAIVGAIALFVWTYRVTRIANYVGIRTVASPVGSLVWYFVPLANLVQPHRQLVGIVRSGRGRVITTVNLWWGTWCVAFTIGALSGSWNPSTLDEWQGYYTLTIVDAVLRSIGVLLTLALIREVHAALWAANLRRRGTAAY